MGESGRGFTALLISSFFFHVCYVNNFGSMPQLGLHAKAKQRSLISTVEQSCTSLVCPFNRGHNNNAPKNFGRHLKNCKVSGFPSVTRTMHLLTCICCHSLNLFTRPLGSS